jgi:hypothetical protein
MRKKRSAGRNGMGTEEVTALLCETKDSRGKAMWMLDLLCGLKMGDLARLEEVNSKRRELTFYGGETIRLNQRIWSELIFILRCAGHYSAVMVGILQEYLTTSVRLDAGLDRATQSLRIQFLHSNDLNAAWGVD